MGRNGRIPNFGGCFFHRKKEQCNANMALMPMGFVYHSCCSRHGKVSAFCLTFSACYQVVLNIHHQGNLYNPLANLFASPCANGFCGQVWGQLFVGLVGLVLFGPILPGKESQATIGWLQTLAASFDVSSAPDAAKGAIGGRWWPIVPIAGSLTSRRFHLLIVAFCLSLSFGPRLGSSFSFRFGFGFGLGTSFSFGFGFGCSLGLGLGQSLVSFLLLFVD